MKLIKYLFFLILILFIGSAIYFSTKDGTYNISESKVMKVPASMVFNNVNDYKNWPAWIPWLEIDPDTKITYGTTTTGEGASYAWDSENMEVGKGNMTTLKVVPNQEIQQQIIFNSLIGDSKSDVWWKFEPIENTDETIVTWGMKGEQSLLEKAFMSFMDGDMETMIRKSYQKGLSNLENKLKKAMQVYDINVNGISQYGGGYYMYSSTSANINNVQNAMARLMQETMQYMKTNNIPMTGAPFTIYNQIDATTGNTIFSAAIPVKENIITPPESNVLCGFMQPVTTVKTTLQGNYINLKETYTTAMEYVSKNGYTPHPTAKMFEVYLTDPEKVLNPAEWITEVYIPIVTTKPE